MTTLVLAYAMMGLQATAAKPEAVLLKPPTLRIAKLLPALLLTSERQTQLAMVPHLAKYLPELDSYLYSLVSAGTGRGPTRDSFDIKKSVWDALITLAIGEDPVVGNAATQVLARLSGDTSHFGSPPVGVCGNGYDESLEGQARVALGTVADQRSERALAQLAHPDVNTFYGAAQALSARYPHTVLVESLRRANAKRGVEQTAALLTAMNVGCSVDELASRVPSVSDLTWTQVQWLKLSSDERSLEAWTRTYRPRSSAFYALSSNDPPDPSIDIESEVRERGKKAFSDSDPLVALSGLTYFRAPETEIRARAAELVAIRDKEFLDSELNFVCRMNPDWQTFSDYVKHMSPEFAENLLYYALSDDSGQTLKLVFAKVFSKLEGISSPMRFNVFNVRPDAFMPELRRMSVSNNKFVRRSAAQTLSRAFSREPETRQGVFLENHLAWGISDPDEEVRWETARAISDVTPELGRIIFDSVWRTLLREHVHDLICILGDMKLPHTNDFLSQIARSGDEQYAELANAFLDRNQHLP